MNNLGSINLPLSKSSKKDLKVGGKTLAQARKTYMDWRNHKKTSKLYLCTLFAMVDGKCPQCDNPMFLTFTQEERPDKATLDHVDSLAQTMKHNKLNLQIMCRGCNAKKGKS